MDSMELEREKGRKPARSQLLHVNCPQFFFFLDFLLPEKKGKASK